MSRPNADASPVVLETPRLTLRKLTPNDAETLFRLYHEPNVFTFFSKGPPESVEIERANLVRHLDHYERHGFGLWATVLRESGELIGRCGLLNQTVDDQPEVEIGYLLSPRFWGRGLASEAARAIRDFGFGKLGRTRLISIIHVHNEPSKRVARAIGMTPIKQTKFNGVDVEIFAIERSKHS
ncbi:MAG TPA: GNAT family N-acetyltransferase [Pirellulales bacterium]